MTEFQPIPDPAGALEPPRRFPPTAVGAATPPEPEPEPVAARGAGRRRTGARHRSPLELALLLTLGLPLVGLVRGVRAVRQLVRGR